LEDLNYDENPVIFQEIIKKSYNEGLKKVQIDGVKIIPVPLFEVLDGKDTKDYV
jgi:hypothetical protein